MFWLSRQDLSTQSLSTWGLGNSSLGFGSVYEYGVLGRVSNVVLASTEDIYPSPKKLMWQPIKPLQGPSLHWAFGASCHCGGSVRYEYLYWGWVRACEVHSCRPPDRTDPLRNFLGSLMISF